MSGDDGQGQEQRFTTLCRRSDRKTVIERYRLKGYMLTATTPEGDGWLRLHLEHRGDDEHRPE